MSFHSLVDSSNKKIVINARGIKFKVYPQNFHRYPRTRLGKLVQKIQLKEEAEITKLCDEYDLNSNEYYFDRDPFLLNRILSYYTSESLHIGHSECVHFIRDELEYWQIDEYALNSCCKIIYFEKCNEVDDSIKNEAYLRNQVNFKEDFGTKFYPEIREKIWNLFDNPNSSICGKILFYFSTIAILVSITDIVVKTLPSQMEESDYEFGDKSDLGKALDVIEIVCISWFVIELLIRFAVCPSKLKFLRKPLNLIDVVSILPFFIWLILTKYNIPKTAKQILSLLRIMLLFKTTRYSSSLKSFGQTIKSSIKELLILLIYLSIGVIFFSSIVFYCEKDINPLYSSIPATFWWGLITMTTVGYGDMYPMSIPGKIFGGLCAIFGVLIVSMPVGVISSKFSELLEKEKKEKKFLKIEKQLVKMKRKLYVFDERFNNEVTNGSKRRELKHKDETAEF